MLSTLTACDIHSINGAFIIFLTVTQNLPEHCSLPLLNLFKIMANNPAIFH